MILSRMSPRCILAAVIVFTTVGEINNADAALPGQSDAEEGVEVLTRGPVHEAFAETISFDPEPGIIVSKQPPEAIEEVAPDYRPEGDNVAWIPGYLAWDDEREDFLWVSGIWRDLPPGRQWIPGYWTEVESGHQWISGYWADASQTEIQYLPEPPATAEAGPNIEAPSPEYNWLPGCWIWQQNRYAWRPGYWAPMQADWDWVPAHYVCSPRGYVFVDGYFDYSVSRRGVLFAPVYLTSGVYSRAGYSYSPSTVIDLRLFTAHLFSRPQYHHYYFGDYYANNYSNSGYYPWFSYNSGGHGYDPFYARQRWVNRDDRDWHSRIESEFEGRRNDEDRRPPRTLAAQMKRDRNSRNAEDKALAVTMSLDQLSRNQDSPQRFQVVGKDERELLARRRQEIQKFRKERQTREAEPTAVRPDHPTAQNGPSEPVNVTLPKSPVVSAAIDRHENDASAPKKPEAPRVDSNVVAKPRVPRETKPDRRNAKRPQKHADSDPISHSVKKPAGIKPRSDKTSNSKINGDKSDPMRDIRKLDQDPNASTLSPKPENPLVPRAERPRGSSRPNGGKGATKIDVPVADQKSIVPRTDSNPVPPKRDLQSGRKEPHKVDPPKAESTTRGGKVVPETTAPKVAPKPVVPRVEPKPQVPRIQPERDTPKTVPVKPIVPRVEPKPQVPKTQPKKPVPPKTDPPKPVKP